MSQDDRKPLEVDTSLSLDGKTMTAGAAAKLSLPQRFFEFFFSRRVVNNAALRALTDDIDRKLAAGVPLSELTPAQHQLLAGALAEHVSKEKNMFSIFDRATKYAPELKALFEAPQSSPEALPPASQEQPKDTAPPPDTRTYWWERFRADAEVVSVEYIQELYAKLLVGQARRPGAFSLKTLDVVRSLDEDTAALFHKFRGFFVPAFGVPPFDDQRWQEYGLRYGDLMDLADVGLVDRTRGTWDLGPEESHIVQYQRWHFRLTTSRSALPRQLHGHRITRSGVELLTILEPDHSKFEVVCRWLSGPHPSGFEVSENGEDGPFVPWVDPAKK